MIMKMHIFRKLLLGREDSVSGMSVVSYRNDSEKPLQNTENLRFYGKLFISLT